MANLNSNMIFAILAGIVLIAIIYYLNKNNDQPIPNDGTITNMNGTINDTQKAGMSMQYPINNRSDVSDSIVDELVSQYNIDDRLTDVNDYSPSDPMANDYGQFTGYAKKNQINMNKMELPYSNTEHDDNDFTYKKKKFTQKTPTDIKDLFDVQKMLPQEIEKDWFDVEPLQCTKQIEGTQWIHPKIHMGRNTIGNTMKNPSLDIRGDIPNPKIGAFMWNNSTIDNNPNPNGICNPRKFNNK